MIRVSPSRARPADRVQTPSDKTPVVQVKSYPAPTGGLVTNAAFSSEAGASVLENFWPTRQGIEPRGGSQTITTVPTEVRALFPYRSGREMFAATETEIYRFDETSPFTLGFVVNGFTSGRWWTYETTTAGGSFLVAVNGADPMLIYNGTAWQSVTAASTPFAITGVDTQFLAHVWGHGSRLFFVQRGTLSAWYSGSNSVAGELTLLPLASVFRRGGSLAFGGTFSSDAGDGLDDRCVFVTDNGEVAIYSGTNPGDINNWSLQGVYDIAQTLGPGSAIQIGGDLVFATARGLFPLSGIIGRDPAEMRALSYSAAIEPDWVAAAVGQPEWTVTKWDAEGMLVAAPLGGPRIFASNLETKAWAPITGWPVSAIASMNGSLWFGTAEGQIKKAWVGGRDDALPFVCRSQLAFDHMGDPSAPKVVATMQATWTARARVMERLSVAQNYRNTFPDAPTASAADAATEAPWGSPWGISWSGTGSELTQSGWVTVPGAGFALAPQIQVTSATNARLSARLERVDLTYKTGLPAA